MYGRWQRGVRGFKTEADIAARIAEADAHQIAEGHKRKKTK
jgi:hypothetical protein